MDYSQEMLSYTYCRELSWLKFNERVLSQAADPGIPLMERLRFVSIFTSNMDEFFMVRVGSLIDMNMLTPDERDNKSGMTASEQLTQIYAAVRPLIERRDRIYLDLTKELAAEGVEEVPYEKLTENQKNYLRDYYKSQIKPLLSPQVIDRSHPFPHLKNKELYAAALLTNKGKQLLGIVDIPNTVPPILMLPGGSVRYVRTETVVSMHLKKLFKIYNVEEQAVISVTRNADINLDDEKFEENNPDFLFYMTRLLRKRDRLAPVRLEVQGNAPGLSEKLIKALKLTNEQVYVCRCPLVLKYAYMIDKAPAHLYNKPYTPVYPEFLDRERSIAEQVKQRDVLLFYPYHSMQPFIDLLRQSAEDPQVVSIKITIYRLARNSAIAKALCAAAENGKEVIVLMELRARFDEQNNIDWSRELEDSGCHILYGPEGYKCHAKLCLITRKDKNGLSYISQIGTGNYNEKTSTQYTDFCMMTARESIAKDAVTFFENMMIGHLYGEYDTLMVAPNAMKNHLLQMIDDEIAKGSEGRIIIKANSVTERELIDKLSEASCVGVKIDLIIRGICCLLPGIEGKTENITVTSIVGRFLEHSRIYCFGKGEDMKMYIASADLMTRNQVRRVEVGGPVLSPELKRFMKEYLDRLLIDNTRAWRELSDGSYVPVKKEADEEANNIHTYYMEHPIQLNATEKVQEKKFGFGFLKMLRRKTGGKDVGTI